MGSPQLKVEYEGLPLNSVGACPDWPEIAGQRLSVSTAAAAEGLIPPRGLLITTTLETGPTAGNTLRRRRSGSGKDSPSERTYRSVAVGFTSAESAIG